MDVKLEQHVGNVIGTGREVRFDQYRVRVDGFTVGYIGFKPGSQICLTQRFGPLELAEIERKVGELLESEVSSKQVPDVPDDMMNPSEDDEDYDDFDA